MDVFDECFEAFSRVDSWRIYERVEALYNWDDVVYCVEFVYDCVYDMWDMFMGCFYRLYCCGVVFGKMLWCVAAVTYLWWRVFEFFEFVASIEFAFVFDDECFDVECFDDECVFVCEE